MSTNHLFHKFLAEVKAGYANCEIKNIEQSLWHLNRALEIAKRPDTGRLKFDVEFWIESIRITQATRALIGMQNCIQTMENFKTLLDQEEN